MLAVLMFLAGTLEPQAALSRQLAVARALLFDMMPAHLAEVGDDGGGRWVGVGWGGWARTGRPGRHPHSGECQVGGT